MEISIAGMVVFWTASERTSHDRLKAELESIGEESLLPPKRPPQNVLFDAISEYAKGEERLVRKLQDPGSYSIVAETKGKEANQYETVLMARVDQDDSGITLRFRPFDERAGQITTIFNKHNGIVTSGQVGSALAAAVRSMRCVVLRPTGGIYWIAEDFIPRMQRIAGAFEAAGANKVYFMRTAMDIDAVRAIRDMLTAQVMAQAVKLQEDIGSQLGSKALENRMRQADELMATITQYEDLLGQSLGNLRSAVDDAVIAKGRAAMVASYTEVA